MPDDYRARIETFLSLKAREAMNSHIWDLPIVTRDVTLDTILSVLRSSSYIWVVNDKKDLHLEGVIELIEVLCYFIPPREIGIRYGSLSQVLRSLHMKSQVRAEDLMETKFVYCTPDTTLRDVLIKMVKFHIRRIAVLDENGKLVGDITLRGLINLFYQFFRFG